MRTITFEVEVDDKIFDTMVPSVYDDAVKNAPNGRLFLCADKTSVVKKLVKLHCDVTAEGEQEAPWIENYFLPEEMRIVKMSTHDERPADAIPEGLVETDWKTEQEDMGNEWASRIVAILTDILQRQFDNQQELLKKHEELLDHFKLCHEYENWLQEHQTRAEDRLMNHTQECCDKATLTTKQYAEALMQEFAKVPTMHTPHDAQKPSDSCSGNQVLLRAMDVLESALKK